MSSVASIPGFTEALPTSGSTTPLWTDDARTSSHVGRICAIARRIPSAHRTANAASGGMSARQRFRSRASHRPSITA